MKFWHYFAIAFFSAFSPALGWCQKVAFINPGKSDEAYWVASSKAMQMAAKSLNMQLEIQYAERQHLRTFDIARELIARPPEKRPDYVIFSNGYLVGIELLRMFEASTIRCFMAYSTLTDEEIGQAGKPRERFKNWIGSLEPRAEDAGYLTANALIKKARSMGNLRAPDKKLHIIAIAGDRSSHSSILRNEGMQRAVKEHNDVVLDQIVYADWKREKAKEQAVWLFERYPHAKLIWGGNDLMAFGAMDALEKRGGTPGQTALFSGVNTSDEAMEAIRSGRLTALAGGHFITGAWAMVMLYDHAHGKDFASEGLEPELPMFMLFTPKLTHAFQDRFGEQYKDISFRQYSKVYNPKLRRYTFGFEQLLK